MSNEVFVPSQYSTIEDALTHVPTGGVIRISPGLYMPTNTIVIDKAVTILGPFANIDPRPSYGSMRMPGDQTREAIVDGGGTLAIIFQIKADDVVINGLEIRHGTGDLIDSLAVPPIKYRTKIKYNIIHDSSGDEGVQLRNVTNGEIEYNHIFNTRGDAINFCCGSNNCVIRFNEVHNIGSEDGAIYVYNATNTTIEGNLIYDVLNNDGIKLGDKEGHDANSTGGSIINNRIFNTNQDGITVYTSNTLVKGNEVFNSRSENGVIYVSYNVDNVKLEYNCVHDNGVSGDGRTTYGIRIGKDGYYPTNVIVNYNNISGNFEGGLYYNSPPNAPHLDARYNWWGSSAGPNTPGADTVTGNVPNSVDFVPWLNTSPSCGLLPKLTTGPIVSDKDAKSILVKVLNNNDFSVNFRVNIYDIGACPKTIVYTTDHQTLSAKCTAHFIFAAPPEEYEVEFEGMGEGIFGWTSTRKNSQKAAIKDSTLIAANTFRHSELIQNNNP